MNYTIPNSLTFIIHKTGMWYDTLQITKIWFYLNVSGLRIINGS